MVSVPMETDPGGLVGVLNVHTVERREFTARDVELLLVIGRLIAGALHQARLHRQLVARERAHENFVEQVIEAQEIERRRLAGDIHDGISQRLITLSYRLDAASRRCRGDPDAAAAQLEQGSRTGRPDAAGGPRGDQRVAATGARRPRPGGWAREPRALDPPDRYRRRPGGDPRARPHRARVVPDRAGMPAERRQARQGHVRAAHIRR